MINRTYLGFDSVFINQSLPNSMKFSFYNRNKRNNTHQVINTEDKFKFPLKQVC